VTAAVIYQAGCVIACDESGYEGDKLINTTTDVFAHGSVRLDAATAAGCMAELRNMIRSPAMEYKAGHVLREKHRLVLEWVLGPSSPLCGNGHVYLIDKAFYVVTRLLGAQAPAFYRRERGKPWWQEFLVSANDFLRGLAPAPVLPVDLVESAGAAHLVRREIDPLVPAIVRAVEFWSGGGEPVEILHDRQKTLTPQRIARIRTLVDGRLAALRFGDSGVDPRVQMADILAGAARKIASDELDGRGDPALTGLLRPYVDAESVWEDERSRAALVP
jgi:hypothetical protein